MERTLYTAVLLTLLVLVAGSLALAQGSCSSPSPPTVGSSVRVSPDVVVTAMEIPGGNPNRTVIQQKAWRYLPGNRMITMMLHPYPGMTQTELAFAVTKGWYNLYGMVGLDVEVVGPDGKHPVTLKSMRPGVFCGTTDLAPGWNKIVVWVTTPTESYLTGFGVWSGDWKDKPRNVRWVCPVCGMSNTGASCGSCMTAPRAGTVCPPVSAAPTPPSVAPPKTPSAPTVERPTSDYRSTGCAPNAHPTTTVPKIDRYW